ncbi:MAG: VTT domain-containing protein [Acetobacteraceae bacterium]|nr:VTT domain-containing protein [Acetobacteraceae bacterium]
MLGTTVNSLLLIAGHQPILQALAIVIGTFILEDAATVLAAMQAEQGTIPVSLALGSLFAGIVLGDLGLYALGRLAARIGWLARWLPPRRQSVIRAWISGRVFVIVLTSRFLPGLRLPTYTTCGFVGANFRQFTLAAVVATTCWTSLLFAVSLQAGKFLIDHFGAWRWAGAVGFILFIIIAGRIAAAGVESARR